MDSVNGFWTWALFGGFVLLVGGAALAVAFGGGVMAWAVARLPFANNTAKFRRSVSLAVKSLWLHKLRSFLSVLGIIIGTCSVIALMSFGEGSMQDALDDIKRQGATNIIVRSVKPPDDSATASKGFVTTYGLVQGDLDKFSTFGKSVSRMVPIRVFPMEVRNLDRLVNCRVIGTLPEYAEVNKLQMSRGRFLNAADEDVVELNDDQEMKNICILGSEVADKLFPYEDALGQSVLMKGQFFKVVGVVKERMPTGGTGGSQAAEEYNRDVYIPFKTSRKRFGEIITTRSSGSRSAEKVDISQVTLTVDAEVDKPAGRAKVQAVGDEIKAMLEKRHPRKDYAVTVPLDKLEEAERAQSRFTILMAMIASISLFVGGIGIMNIMLATVTERTREIGIRRALGAKRKDIVMQFLVEAVVQTTIGGLAGALIGVLSVFALPAAWDLLRGWEVFTGPPLPAVLHVPSIFLSVGVSILVGMAFGLYPAWRAAKLDPIEACGMSDKPDAAGGAHTRYPGLDLLRALAIVLVVNCHAANAFELQPERHVLRLGGKGVDLFFVLSGWLLGRQLMRELRDSGTIDLRRFWLRRWLRTLPAYYAVLALTFAWQLARGNFDLRLSYLFFGQTYLTDLPYFSVSWSLCVEEHFYLAVAPALLLFWRVRAALALLPLLLVFPFLCRMYEWHLGNPDMETHARYDPCAIGVLLAAIDVARPRIWAVLKRLAPVLAFVGLIAAGRDVACRLNPQWGMGDQGIFAWALIFGSWVLLAAARPNWSLGRLPGVRYVAERSYAVYLLHPEAFALLRKLPDMPFVVYLALTWAVSLLLSEVLFRLVERPGMRLRERFGASRSREAK